MSTSSSKKYKLIGLLFLALYVMTHLGFYKTYFIHFPSFEKFQLLHHVHGFLMSTWILMLVTQPLLIGYGKVRLHHFVGRLSYVIAPLLIVSLFLITKMSYNKGVLLSSPRDAIADQALSIAQLFTFSGFYALAMAYRKNADRHMRYIIGTGLLMILPGLNRLLGSFYNTDFNLALVISSVLTIGRFWKPLKQLLNDIDINNKFGRYFACGIVKQRHNWMYSQCYAMSKLSLRL